MSASLETVTSPRFACIFFESYADPPSDAGTCRTGEPDWKHFRRHLKIRHVCNCKSNCEISMHFPADHIKHILDLDKKGVLYHVSWTKMYRLAHPDPVHAPAPYLPTISQALAVARNPSEDFMKMLVLNFADHGNTTQEEATKNALNFVRYLPVFHDTLSRTGSRPAGHIVPQTAIADDHPNTPAFVADEGPLQLPTPAADDTTSHENILDPDELSIDGWVFDDTAQDGQEHMNFLDTAWDDHFAQHD